MTEEELMLTAILDCERTQLYSQPLQLTAVQLAQFALMQERRSQNEPLQYILGQTDFFGFKFKVDARVLIPRPETELLVEDVLAFALHRGARHLRILEVGTGSGNIAVSLAQSLSAAGVVALDISLDALSVARENARINKVAGQIDFVHCDFFEFADNYCELERSFDIIVSNPPYIATSLLNALPAEVRAEPVLALDGGEDGLRFYRGLIPAAKRFLRPGGCLACEIGDGQKAPVTSLLTENGFARFYFKNDYRDTPRFFLAHN